MAIVLPDNFMIGVFRLLLTWIAWGAIAVGVVRIGNRKGWWSGLSERSDPVGSIDIEELAALRVAHDQFRYRRCSDSAGARGPFDGVS